MALSWDILLNDISIKDHVFEFQLKYSELAYVREMTLFSVDPSFFDSFDFTKEPDLVLEIRTKLEDTWVSQGKFFIEKPVYALTSKNKISRGVWGRSETAKAGEPFASKITKTWETDTTIQSIITEMVDLVGLSVIFEIDDYSVFAGTYSVDLYYPIQVINELCVFAGALVTSDSDGNIVIKKQNYHIDSIDYVIDDVPIRELTEKIIYPEFGNRIKISSFGNNAGYNVDLVSSKDQECLPADNESSLILYSFVTSNGLPVNDGVVVNWSIGNGAFLARETSVTGPVLIANQNHKADNYNQVTVDYPVAEVIGIWAYSDRNHTHNYWEPNNLAATFDKNVITVATPFDYCDQNLIITYLAAGCAINKVTAGPASRDVDIVAETGGAEDTLTLKIGNTCACGTTLQVIKSTESNICFGNKAPFLIAAEISGGPALGMVATLTLVGCGELSSTKKILDKIDIVNEIQYVINEIIGTSQVETSIFPDPQEAPKVFLITDTQKTNDLYFSHDGKVIDLNTIIPTGSEVYVDYSAVGASAVNWLTDDITTECDAEVLVKIADGTETGLTDTISFSASNCSGLDPSESDPLFSEYSSINDPNKFDNDAIEGGLSECEEQCDEEPPAEKEECIDDCQRAGEGSGGVLTDCATIVLNRISNIDNATADEKDGIRFGFNSFTDCTLEDPFGCSCEELCDSEIREKGNTYDYNETIHEQVIKTYEYETAEYYEEYSRLRDTNVTACESKCEQARSDYCGCEMISGPDVMSPGETAEFVCSDGTIELYTMPEDACGTIVVSIGCCTKDVRSTVGQWVFIDSYNQCGCVTETSGCGPYSCTSGDCVFGNLIIGRYRYTGSNRVFYAYKPAGVEGDPVCSDCDCQLDAIEGSCIPGCGALGCVEVDCIVKTATLQTSEWQC